MLRRAIQLVSGERALTTLPVFVLANLASGVTSIIPDADMRRPGAVSAARLAKQIGRLKPTRAEGSPAFFGRLLQLPGTLQGFAKIYLGGASVFPALLQDIRRHAPDARIFAVYGSTEAEPIAAYEAGGGDAETKVATEGRIWHRTGDAGYFDMAQNLWLVGRCSAKTVCADGIVLYPFAMECAAMRLPFIQRAAMIQPGGTLTLAVQTAEGMSPGQMAALGDALARFPPHTVARMKAIPVDRRHNAKIDYPALLARFPQNALLFAQPVPDGNDSVSFSTATVPAARRR